MFPIRLSPKTETRLVVRLEATQLDELRRQLGGIATTYVSSETTDLQAGYMLGINRVLNLLEQGFTLPRKTS